MTYLTEKRVLWLDLETTGLSPAKHNIIEVGVVLYNEDCTKRVVEEAHVIKTEMSDWDNVHHVPLEMHQASGLMCRSLAAEFDLAEVEAKLVEALGPYAGDEPFRLGGSSVNFDLGFIQHRMPNLYEFIHRYRVVDVTSIGTFMANTFSNFEKSDRVTSHTALADINDSIKEYQSYQEFILSGKGIARHG